MRHQKSGRKLGRNSPHRTAMFRNLATSLLTHETVRTTLPKAKELRRVVEPLITLGKEDSVAHRRLAFSRLRDNVAVGRLFTELGPRFQKRPGGYLRILKFGFRLGDNAPMALVELLDRPEPASETSEDGKQEKKAKSAKNTKETKNAKDAAKAPKAAEEAVKSKTAKAGAATGKKPKTKKAKAPKQAKGKAGG